MTSPLITRQVNATVTVMVARTHGGDRNRTPATQCNDIGVLLQNLDGPYTHGAKTGNSDFQWI